MKKRTIAVTIGSAVFALGIAGGAVALAGSDDEGSPATSAEEEHVVAAALAATGGGEANAVERDAEKGATWEVEVTTTDGSTVDVRLDRNLHLIAVDADREDANGR